MKAKKDDKKNNITQRECRKKTYKVLSKSLDEEFKTACILFEEKWRVWDARELT